MAQLIIRSFERYHADIEKNIRRIVPGDVVSIVPTGSEVGADILESEYIAKHGSSGFFEQKYLVVDVIDWTVEQAKILTEPELELAPVEEWPDGIPEYKISKHRAWGADYYALQNTLPIEALGNLLATGYHSTTSERVKLYFFRKSDGASLP